MRQSCARVHVGQRVQAAERDARLSKDLHFLGETSALAIYCIMKMELIENRDDAPSEKNRR